MHGEIIKFVSDKRLLIRTMQYLPLRHNVINLTGFKGIQTQ